MGKLKLWGGISGPLTNFRGRSNTPSMRGHRPSLTSENQSPSPYGWPGRGNYLEKKFQQFSFRHPLKNYRRLLDVRISPFKFWTLVRIRVRIRVAWQRDRLVTGERYSAPKKFGHILAKIQRLQNFQGALGEIFGGYVIEVIPPTNWQFGMIEFLLQVCQICGRKCENSSLRLHGWNWTFGQVRNGISRPSRDTRRKYKYGAIAHIG